MVVSFTTKYLEQFEGSKDTVNDRGVNFNAIKNFEEWDAGDGRNGLGNVINTGIPREKAELSAHIKIALAGHMTAHTLCDSLLAQVCVWWYWFYPTYNTFHGKILRRGCPDGKYSKDAKSCCGASVRAP